MTKIKVHHQKVFVFILFFGIFIGYGLLKSQQIRSANLTSVSVTLSTPRLSFVGKLTTGNSVGSSVITINTTPNGPSSTSSAELAEGDVVAIGDTNNLNTYTVASASSTLSQFTIKSPNFATLQSGNVDSGDAVISTQSATHTVRFTTATAVANGAFQILVPATSISTRNDGIPDQDGFDFGTSAPTVTCPSDVASTYDFVAGTATASAVTLSGVTYHAYECRYSGSGGSGTAFDGTTQGAITVNSIINPSPKTSHVQGYADTYKIIVRQLQGNAGSADTAVDQTTVTVGAIESVRVTATVPPQITFAILGVASGTTACGVSTNVATTPITVPFGEVSISSFTNAAQGLTVSTNAASGFAVTAVANDQMGKNGAACTGDPPSGTTCIPDTTGNGGAMTQSASAEWTSTSSKGFGYSLDDINTTTTEAFSYTTSSGNCTGTFCAREFADAENSQSPVTIFSATAPADNQNLYVCYRVIVASTQQAGDYENLITYRATATF